jgi:ubiquinone/menaquinone biosynthesis C-methylase UbiE
MIDQQLLTEYSRIALANDLRVLQGFRLGATDREHIEQLLAYMDPAPNTTWLDIGCGFGEPARLMSEIRPDLAFRLVNNNRFQLDQVPEELPTWYADMHMLPLEDCSVDGAMFLFSLCHADEPHIALTEAWRVVRPGGKLFVFDYLRAKGDDYVSWYYLKARFLSLSAMSYLCRFVGWQFDACVVPQGSDAVFRSVFEDQALYDRIFDELTPIIWWATRK